MRCLAPLMSAVLATQGLLAESPFNIPGSVRQWAPSRNFHQEKIRVVVTPCFATRKVEVETELSLRALGDGVDLVRLDADGLTVKTLAVDGTKAVWFQDKKQLVIRLDRAHGYGEPIHVFIRTEAGASAGFVFSPPKKPGDSWEFFTDSDPEHNALWFPAYHHPDDRSRFEATLRVPKGLTGIAPGDLVTVTESGGLSEFTYVLDQPIPTYLMAVAGGAFVHVDDGAARVQERDIKIGHWIPEASRAWTVDSLEQTPKLIEAFSQFTGVAFPWSHYDLVVLRDFKGGEEYPTCTFLGFENFHPQGGNSDAWPHWQAIAIHEVAHSWFGDWVTSSTWGDAWIKEGFPSYFAGIGLGMEQGPEAFEWVLWSLNESYKETDRLKYRRPLATTYWPDADSVCDRIAYHGGATRAHMLRHWFGDAMFTRILGHFLGTHGCGLVSTGDLRSSIQAVTGQSMDRWFDAWVYGAGFPELETHESYDPNLHEWVARIRQVQQPTRGTAEVFPFPLDVRLQGAKGSISRRVWIQDRDTVVRIPCAEAPLYAVLDDGGNIPMRVKRERPAAEILRQTRDANLCNRLEALHEAWISLKHDVYLETIEDLVRAEPLEEVRAFLKAQAKVLD